MNIHLHIFIFISIFFFIFLYALIDLKFPNYHTKLKWKNEDLLAYIQLQYSQDEETRDKVEIVAILSMTEKEVDDALKIVGGLFLYFLKQKIKFNKF